MVTRRLAPTAFRVDHVFASVAWLQVTRQRQPFGATASRKAQYSTICD
jgi:hypothetical protein